MMFLLWQLLPSGNLVMERWLAITGNAQDGRTVDNASTLGIRPGPVTKLIEVVMDAEDSVLKQLANNSDVVKAFGKSYQIKRFTLGPLTQAAEYVGPLGYLLKRLLLVPKDEQGRPQLNEEQIMDFVVTAVSISGPSVMGLISVATKEPVNWLEEQEPMDGMRIFAKVVEKNLDFFTQQNFDQLKDAFAPLMERILKLGGDTSTTS